MSQDLIIGIAGAGGDGVISAGESLITAAALEGYHGIMTKSFGSQIRGGEASCRLRLAPDKLPLHRVTPGVVFSVPITEMAVTHAGTDKAKNIVVIGLLAGWFGIGRESMLAGIRKKFAKKGAP